MTLTKKAWQIDRQLRLNAIPIDRRLHPSRWDAAIAFPSGDDLIALFWQARVPGSGAPEIPFVEMVSAMANRGYDVSRAEALLPEGIRLAAEGNRPELRALTACLLAALFDSPPLDGHPYFGYAHPDRWEDILAAMDAPDPRPSPHPIPNLAQRIFHGWLGQLAGGAFGTCIEGYHSRQIERLYGEINGYIVPPETMNDDVVYELVFLDVFERLGRQLTSQEIGLEWLRQIPFGWSAEWAALENLRRGIIPPQSGSFRNPYCDFIGAQMRGMVCGMLAPGWPLEATRLAHLDGVVSHAANGVYGEMYAAALTALAFVEADPRRLIIQAARYLPQQSEYRAVIHECLEALHQYPDYRSAWAALDVRFETYNWMHAYPNLAADLLALWFGGGDFSHSFKILAHAGLDVDCNAGLVGNVLGIIGGVPPQWADPLGNLLETYLPGKERISIRALAERTARLALTQESISSPIAE